MKIVPNRIIIILAVFFLSVTNVFADPGPPPPSTPPPPPGLPLDGGILLLVILSISYGLYKLNKIKKASN
ncbi:PID-CTERM protein-sorting domain-containing protein [Flavobacterium wongokense]|uniref:PID-CTERM protein-sorting domain-containing protein n=1 Tax=Flavobacterium wongokense TaxID=2910674 RepID=UPI00351CDFFE